MLARTYGPKFSRFPCFVQPKINGVRAVYQQNPVPIFQSRGEQIWKHKILAHLHEELSCIHIPSGFALDGELYVHGWRLQRINSAVTVKSSEPTLDTPHIQFHIFDVVHPALFFSVRFLEFQFKINALNLPHIVAVPAEYIYFREELDQHFKSCISAGFEGVMLRPDGPYEPGETAHGTQKRSRYLWKHKQWEDAEFVCIGVTPGIGKADIGIGALTCAAHPEKLTNVPIEQLDKYTTFNVGTGFTDEERVAFSLVPPIGRLVRVRYPYLSDDGIPQCPSFLAVM